MSPTSVIMGRHAPSHAERERMLMSVQPMIKGEVRRAGIPLKEFEDLCQEMQLVAWKATAAFDPGRGVKFSSYACSVLRRALANWRVKHHAESRGFVSAIGGTEELESMASMATRRREDFADSGKVDDEDMIDDEAATEISKVVRRSLSEAFLAKLTPGHRRIIEAVAFDGLRPEQFAEQVGHPAKTVRANLKTAIRKLSKLGLVSHVADDAEVAAVTAPRNPKAVGQQKRREERKQARAAEQQKKAKDELLADLGRISHSEGFAVVLNRRHSDTRVIVTSLIDRTLDFDQSAELLGTSKTELMRKLREFVRKVSKQGQKNATVESKGTAALAM